MEVHVPRLQKPLRCECRRNCRASGNKKDLYAVAVMQRSTIVSYVSAACSVILADQLLAHCFWQIRDVEVLQGGGGGGGI